MIGGQRRQMPGRQVSIAVLHHQGGGLNHAHQCRRRDDRETRAGWQTHSDEDETANQQPEPRRYKQQGALHPHRDDQSGGEHQTDRREEIRSDEG